MLEQPPLQRALVRWGRLPGDMRPWILLQRLARLGVHALTRRRRLANPHDGYLHLEVLAEEPDADIISQAQQELRLLASHAEQRCVKSALLVAARARIPP